MSAFLHPVYVQSRVFAETFDSCISCEVFDDLCNRVLGQILSVQHIGVLEYLPTAILVHHRVLELARCSDAFGADDLVGLDVAHPASMNDADIHRIESIGPLFSYNCFKCCHLHQILWCMF